MGAEFLPHFAPYPAPFFKDLQAWKNYNCFEQVNKQLRVNLSISDSPFLITISQQFLGIKKLWYVYQYLYFWDDKFIADTY